MTALETPIASLEEKYPVSKFPYLLDNITPLTKEQARDLVRIGWRCRIFSRVPY